MKKRILPVISLILMLIASAFIIQRTYAPDTTISVEPTPNVYNVGQTFTVQVWIRNVVNLNAWEAKIRYDSSMLTITSVTEGSFLNGPPDYFSTFFAPPFFGTNYLQLGDLITSPDSVSGSGIVANISFNVKDTGKSDLTPFDTKMLTIEGVKIDNTPVNGVFYTTYPHADFPYPYPYHGSYVYVNEPVVFNATAYVEGGMYKGSYDVVGKIIEYTWDFGDGSAPRYEPVVSHTYTRPENHTAQLFVTANDTKTDGSSQLIFVRYAKPQVNFTYSPKPVYKGIETTFDATGTRYWSGYYANYTWNFGDGTPIVTTTNPIIEHTYTKNATKPPNNVTLTVTTKEGYANSSTLPVEVLSGIYANFTYLPKPPYKNEVIAFDADKSRSDRLDPIFSYSWDFGDWKTGTGKTTTHTYDQNGTYTVTLNVTTLGGRNSTSLPLKVFLRPYAHFIYPKPVFKNDTVTFNASDSSIPLPDTIARYIWDFGDGTNQNLTTPITTHRYVYSGNYTVSLVVITNEGAVNSTSNIINVSFPKPTVTHDIAIVWNSATLNATEGYVWYLTERGSVINITVTVRNEGTSTESFSITAYRKDIPIDTQQVNNLLPNTTKTVTFLWRLLNITMVQPPIYTGTYTISINVTLLADQYLTDNIWIAGTVQVKGWGDVNCDGKVNYKDLFILAVNYGKNVPPGDERADINEDGKINYQDLYILAIYYGKSYLMRDP